MSPAVWVRDFSRWKAEEGQRQKPHGARRGLNDHGVQGTLQKPGVRLTILQLHRYSEAPAEHR